MKQKIRARPLLLCFMDFNSCWERVKGNTDLKTLEQLAEIAGTTQPNVSKKKNKGIFPADWAYLVGRKYGLLTEWIMTGEGPKKLSDIKRSNNFDFLLEIDEWLAELVAEEPFREDWFRGVFIDSFKQFAEWRFKKASLKAERGN